MNETKKIYGVITGDIVKSRKIPIEKYDILLYTLETCIKFLTDKFNGRYDIFSGDSFQILFQDPIKAIESSLIIRLTLRTTEPFFDCRQSIGIGAIDTLRESVKKSTGEVFILSGENVNSLKNENIKIFSDNEFFNSRVDLLTSFLDFLVGNITKLQAEALLSYLLAEEKNHANIAKMMRRERTSVTKLLNSSHYQLVSKYLSEVEYFIKEYF
ncbi:hypothetical protein [Pectobacterium carotovorum]|uniref:hypothetical protein n=1 Tax=Pectobacterium carotovorum TaxID=554 RepID=UPI000E7308A8|nr:hypothetical protein [Pectobacterium carotovorum]RJL37295.1 hypothetical protein D5078_21645 [Pectobacterium carotovorum]UFT96066.1 hypothetical protein LQF52_08640 [Pectobacterium carotovorum]